MTLRDYTLQLSSLNLALMSQILYIQLHKIYGYCIQNCPISGSILKWKVKFTLLISRKLNKQVDLRNIVYS